MKSHQDLSLPISEAPYERLENHQCSKKRVLKMTAYPMLALIALFFFFRTGVVGNIYEHCSFFNNDDSQLKANQVYSTCSDPPSVSYRGDSSFSFKPKDYQDLKIKYDINRRNKNQLSVYAGQTIVYEDKSSSDVNVDFDVKLSEELTEDQFYIEKNIENNTYVIDLKGDDYLPRVCVSIDVVIKVPSVSALEGLTIELVNNKFILGDALTFKKLSLLTANGDVDLKKGLTSGDTVIETVNGQIEGTVNSLSGDLSAFTVNGFVKLAVDDVAKQASPSNIKAKTVNGFIDIQLPNNFESAFELKSIIGKKSVDSDRPESIHIERKSFGQLSGYYGNEDQTKNTVSLQTVSGDILLKY